MYLEMTNFPVVQVRKCRCFSQSLSSPQHCRHLGRFRCKGRNHYYYPPFPDKALRLSDRLRVLWEVCDWAGTGSWVSSHIWLALEPPGLPFSPGDPNRDLFNTQSRKGNEKTLSLPLRVQWGTGAAAFSLSLNCFQLICLSKNIRTRF